MLCWWNQSIKHLGFKLLPSTSLTMLLYVPLVTISLDHTIVGVPTSEGAAPFHIGVEPPRKLLSWLCWGLCEVCLVAEVCGSLVPSSNWDALYALNMPCIPIEDPDDTFVFLLFLSMLSNVIACSNIFFIFQNNSMFCRGFLAKYSEHWLVLSPLIVALMITS